MGNRVEQNLELLLEGMKLKQKEEGLQSQVLIKNGRIKIASKGTRTRTRCRDSEVYDAENAIRRTLIESEVSTDTKYDEIGTKGRNTEVFSVEVQLQERKVQIKTLLKILKSYMAQEKQVEERTYSRGFVLARKK